MTDTTYNMSWMFPSMYYAMAIWTAAVTTVWSVGAALTFLVGLVF